jgi:hypothetical protein
MSRPVRPTRRHGGKDWWDRGPIRKRREVNDTRRADGSLTGVLRSALECGESEGAGKPLKKLCTLADRKLKTDDFGGFCSILHTVSLNSIFTTAFSLME